MANLIDPRPVFVAAVGNYNFFSPRLLSLTLALGQYTEVCRSWRVRSGFLFWYYCAQRRSLADESEASGLHRYTFRA